jgi:hypothetical protein
MSRSASPFPPASAPVRQRAIAAFVIGALSLLAVPSVRDPRRGLVVAAVVFVFGAVAVWLGITANRQARRDSTARSAWAFGGVLLGLFGAGIGVLFLAAFAMYWPQMNSYLTCVNTANTVAATQACTNQLKNSIVP